MSDPAPTEEVKTDVSAPIADASENVEAEKAASLVANKVRGGKGGFKWGPKRLTKGPLNMGQGRE